MCTRTSKPKVKHLILHGESKEQSDELIGRVSIMVNQKEHDKLSPFLVFKLDVE
jgi:hypothetical protein